jgi:protein-S-isoprenylcysteine O-methyltransferase Ste14
MYLGHLIFLAGLALTFRSWLGLAIFAASAVWFHRRVLADEAQLRAQFGESYADYCRRVKRWIPGVL